MRRLWQSIYNSRCDTEAPNKMNHLGALVIRLQIRISIEHRRYFVMRSNALLHLIYSSSSAVLFDIVKIMIQWEIRTNLKTISFLVFLLLHFITKINGAILFTEQSRSYRREGFNIYRICLRKTMKSKCTRSVCLNFMARIYGVLSLLWSKLFCMRNLNFQIWTHFF